MAVEIQDDPVPALLRDRFPNPNIPRNVMLVFPWHKQTNPLTALSVMGLTDRRRVWTLMNYGDAYVIHSRNTCADLFLTSECEWMLTIDDDMVVPFGNATALNAYTGFALPEPFASFNAIDRLLASGKKLVGGLYFGRVPGGRAMYSEACSNLAENEFARKSPQDLVKPTKWVGTGCLLIHRTVFTDIEKRYPRLARGADGKGGQWFTPTEASAIDTLRRIQQALSSGAHTGETSFKALELVEKGLADSANENALGMGEDVAFCYRALAAGHQPHVDLGLVCGHVGSYCYGPKLRPV